MPRWSAELVLVALILALSALGGMGCVEEDDDETDRYYLPVGESDETRTTIGSGGSSGSSGSRGGTTGSGGSTNSPTSQPARR